MLSVAEIMTREPYTLAAEDTLAEARKLMAEHHIRHVPIVSPEGTLVGVVSQRDVLAASDSSLAGGGAGDYNSTALSDLMTAPVQTTEPSASLRGAAMFLQQNRLGCLPVLEDGKLVGIVTDSDYVSVAINLMEQLELVEPQENDGLYDEDDF